MTLKRRKNQIFLLPWINLILAIPCKVNLCKNENTFWEKKSDHYMVGQFHLLPRDPFCC